MEELLLNLFGNPQIQQYLHVELLPEMKKCLYTLLNFLKKYIYNHRYSLVLFTEFFTALSDVEQKLIEELIQSGTAKRSPSEFYLEGSGGLRTQVFMSVCNYTWDSQYTIAEEIYAANLPIRAERSGSWQQNLTYKIDTYSFKLNSSYQKAWRKLLRRMKRKCGYL